MKLVLGMELDLSPGDFVLDGDPDPLPKKGGAPPILCLHLLWPNGCMDQDATWYGGRPRLRDIVLDGDPPPPILKGHSPQNFRPMSVMAKRLDGLRRHLVQR